MNAGILQSDVDWLDFFAVQIDAKKCCALMTIGYGNGDTANTGFFLSLLAVEE